MSFLPYRGLSLLADGTREGTTAGKQEEKIMNSKAEEFKRLLQEEGPGKPERTEESEKYLVWINKNPEEKFIRRCFFAGKSLAECFQIFEKIYGKRRLDLHAPFNRMAAAAMIRREWYKLRKENHLPPGVNGVSLDDLLEEGQCQPNTRAKSRKDQNMRQQ
jgi:hypothetical protein